MIDQEVESLNLLLKSCENKKNQTTGVFIDNLHHPFVLLKESYILPSISIHAIEFNAAMQFLQEVCKHIPEMVAGCHVMPQPKPKKEYGKLFLVKEISIENYSYLYILKLDIAYLGGARKENIIKQATQENTASILTDRFYFSSHIIPIQKTIQKSGFIVDFEPFPYNPSLFQIQTSDTGIGSTPMKIESELFDEIDYTVIIKKLKEKLNVNERNWQPGRVHAPISIEYSTLTIQFLEPSFHKTKETFERFYGILESVFINQPIEVRTIENFQKWMQAHHVSRTKSVSGNILWKVST